MIRIKKEHTGLLQGLSQGEEIGGAERRAAAFELLDHYARHHGEAGELRGADADQCASGAALAGAEGMRLMLRVSAPLSCCPDTLWPAQAFIARAGEPFAAN